ncbi:MAG: IS66 family insertion sequence element accessory protein TnpB [Pseudomonas sp.]|nr:IS66 family insertion sequence element accessory protein TnpB [Pseudomonas sp.]
MWLLTKLMDMRTGTETALVRVIDVSSPANQHCAYLFVKRRANHIKALVHDG